MSPNHHSPLCRSARHLYRRIRRLHIRATPILDRHSAPHIRATPILDRHSALHIRATPILDRHLALHIRAVLILGRYSALHVRAASICRRKSALHICAAPMDNWNFALHICAEPAEDREKPDNFPEFRPHGTHRHGPRTRASSGSARIVPRNEDVFISGSVRFLHKVSPKRRRGRRRRGAFLAWILPEMVRFAVGLRFSR